MAMDDVLFWFSSFLFAFEPRSAIKVMPFIPWKHQESVIVAMDKAIDDAESMYEATQTCHDVV